MFVSFLIENGLDIEKWIKLLSFMFIFLSFLFMVECSRMCLNMLCWIFEIYCFKVFLENVEKYCYLCRVFVGIFVFGLNGNWCVIWWVVI